MNEAPLIFAKSKIERDIGPELILSDYYDPKKQMHNDNLMIDAYDTHSNRNTSNYGTDKDTTVDD